MYPELSEEERFPLLTQRGRELLYRMRQHPNAPIWNWPNGEHTFLSQAFSPWYDLAEYSAL